MTTPVLAALVTFWAWLLGGDPRTTPRFTGMKRLGGTLVAFIVGFAAFYPFLQVASAMGNAS